MKATSRVLISEAWLLCSIYCHHGVLRFDLESISKSLVAGGIPERGKLEAELASFWKLPPSVPSAVQPFLGQVAGVCKGTQGSVWVLHRGGRVWDANSFTGNNGEVTTYTEPIAEDVVFQIDQDTGRDPGCCHPRP